MQKNHPIFDDLSRFASGAAGSFMEWRRELERLVQQQVESVCERMQLVRRDEFDAVKAMAQKAREENEALKARLDAMHSGETAASKKTRSSKAKPTE